MSDWNAMSDADFRERIRAYLEAEYPQALRHPPRRLRWHEVKDWYLKQSASGWTAPGWPSEYGGVGLSPAKQIILTEEQERIGVARAPDHGVVMVGPLLIQYGTSEQCEKYLPKILSWEHIWCQGYSEPNSGSDLASLRTQADDRGDHWVVNGQKIWTTLAQDATHIFVLARTETQVERKQQGISFLLVDLETPGVTVRPIENIAGHEEFCEVFFDDVQVPKDNLVGDINEGWTIAKALLGFERLFLGSPKLPQNALARLDSYAQSHGLHDDPEFSAEFTKLQLDVADLSEAFESFAAQVRAGERLG